MEAVRAYERALGRPIRIRRTPRLALRAGRLILRWHRPAIASKMGMALAGDLASTSVGDEGFRDLGIAPRPASAHIAAAGARARG